MSRINNTFQLSGYLGTDPEKRFNRDNGNPICLMAIGVNSSYKNRESGEVVERTDWFDLTVYRESLINVIDQYVRKGSEIHVRGHMRKRTWESKDRLDDDGSPLMDSRYEFVVTELQLGRRPKDDSASTPDTARANTAAAQAGDSTEYDDDIPL